MARYRASIDTHCTLDQSFAYLSELSKSAEWDPGVMNAERAGRDSVGEGAEFRLVAEFLGRTTRGVGDRALAGLREVLARPAPEAVDAAA